MTDGGVASWKILLAPNQTVSLGYTAAMDKEPAAEIRAELQKSLALMPDFGPAHDLLGFVEMVQGEDLAAAEKHLAKAVQLEPENPGYQLTLAQVQLARNEPETARRTLEPLRRPYNDAKVRAHAEQMLREVRPPSAR